VRPDRCAPELRGRPGPRRPSRILYVVNDVALGGAQRVLLNQAAFLGRTRFTVEVASFEFDPSGGLMPSFEGAGIPVHRLRRPDEWPLAGWLRLFPLIRRLRPDVVHTHLAAAGVLGRIAARRSSVPWIVTTLHNLSDWEERRAGALRWLDRRTLPLADTVVTVSDAVRRAFTRVCPRLAPRAVTVRNGVPLAELSGARGERAAMRAALGYEPGHFVVGTVARLERRKGIDTLVEALARAAPHVPELRLLLVGDGPERARLEALALAGGVGDRMRLVRRQSRVQGYLAAMDLFAAPSRTEGLGMAMIEALAVGLPVLGSRVGGIPEVVLDGVCGRLLPPGQPGPWADALVHCASHREELDSLAQAAPARAQAFSLEASGLELERVYDRLLGAEEAAAPAEAAA